MIEIFNEQDLTQNNQNHLKPTVELETELSDEERLKQSVVDVSSEIISAVQENGEVAVREYFYNILSKTDGSVSPEKRLVVFEYLANQQRLANHEEALKFGETAIAELGKESQDINGGIFDLLGSKLNQNIDELKEFHNFGIYSKLKGTFDAESFALSYKKIEDYIRPVTNNYSDFTGIIDNWSNQKTRTTAEYTDESNKLNGRFEGQDRALLEAGKTISLDDEKPPKDLSLLIDESVVYNLSESLSKIINSSIDRGEAPDSSVAQALCEIGEYDASETMHQIDNSLVFFTQLTEQNMLEIKALENTIKEKLKVFRKQSQDVSDGKRFYADKYEALNLSGNQKNILEECSYSVKQLIQKISDIRQNIKGFSVSMRGNFYQGKKQSANEAMFR